MPLSPLQAFKVGFLAKCAEDGLSNEETQERIKLAVQLKSGIAPWIAKMLGGTVAGGIKGVGSMVGSAIPATASLLGTTAVVAPVAAGIAGGYGLAKVNQSDDKDLLESAKQEEIISEYRRLSEEARRKAKAKQLANESGSDVSVMSPR